MERPLTILMPVYNDGKAVAKLLPLLNRELLGSGCRVRLLVVDDGSTQSLGPTVSGLGDLEGFASARLLTLAVNLGHQRAIAVGIAHLAAEGLPTDVVVMDSDGEDSPQDVPRLIAAARAGGVPVMVMAARTKRSESAMFRSCYAIYTVLFRLLTGCGIRFGNFSYIPAEFVPRLARMPELWGHYAAAVIRSRLPREAIPTARSSRLDGVSKMNLTALLLHGLHAIGVFGDVVGVRLVCFSGGCVVGCVLLALVAATWRTFASGWIPGWTMLVLGAAAGLSAAAMLAAVTIVFVALSGRTAACFVPARDGGVFVRDVVVLKEDGA